jgi:hypothetical protein
MAAKQAFTVQTSAGMKITIQKNTVFVKTLIAINPSLCLALDNYIAP